MMETDKTVEFFPRPKGGMTGTTLNLEGLEPREPGESVDFILNVCIPHHPRGSRSLSNLRQVLEQYEKQLHVHSPLKSLFSAIVTMIQSVENDHHNYNSGLLKIHASAWGSFQLSQYSAMHFGQAITCHMLLLYMNPDFNDIEFVTNTRAVDGIFLS